MTSRRLFDTPLIPAATAKQPTLKRILLSWSSGKDSAWSLHILRQRGDYDVVGLLTSFNQTADRVAMHAVRRSLVKLQAHAAGLPLWEVPLPYPCSNQDYESAMRAACDRAVAEDIEGIAFGDLFLEDVRAYREEKLRGTGLQPIFPIWGTPTKALAMEMIDSGLKAKLTCIDTSQLDAGLAGRDFDHTLLSELPDSADPCGERGEFHSFVYAGPMLDSMISVSVGEIRVEERFAFADMVPSTGE
ncbi:MAG TPA: hypothetical protein VN682_08855 [Terriglobales bacterium]|nr:hypothetical protein [Terriglobales bacterium]